MDVLAVARRTSTINLLTLSIRLSVYISFIKELELCGRSFACTTAKQCCVRLRGGEQR